MAFNLVRRAATQISAGAGMSLSDLDRVMDLMFAGNPSYTGKLVSQATALAVDAVWSCVDLISSDIARLPLITYRLLSDEDREVAKDHYLYTLFMNEANPEMNSFRFKKLMQSWLLLWGNAYAEMEISGRGQVTALWPWRPDRVKITRAWKGGPLQYQYRFDDGNLSVPVPGHQMLHLRGLSTDGVMGFSPIDTHRQTIGLSMAVTEHGARFFGQGARPLGVIEHPSKLDDKAFNRLKKEWEAQHLGLENAHRVAILEEGMKWQEAGANMVDAQYIETMAMTAESIARIYQVPQHKIGLLDRATNSNITQQSLDYIQSCIGAWTANWVSEVMFSCLSQRESQTIAMGFNLGDLLQGDYATMGTFIAMLTDRGIASADECRVKYLGWNAQPGGIGKVYWRATNMGPVNADDLPDDSPFKLPRVAPVAPGQGSQTSDGQKPPPKTPKSNGVLHSV
jgi:HK97 family phage portal protein